MEQEKKYFFARVYDFYKRHPILTHLNCFLILIAIIATSTIVLIMEFKAGGLLYPEREYEKLEQIGDEIVSDYRFGKNNILQNAPASRKNDEVVSSQFETHTSNNIKYTIAEDSDKVTLVLTADKTEDYGKAVITYILSPTYEILSKTKLYNNHFEYTKALLSMTLAIKFYIFGLTYVFAFYIFRNICKRSYEKRKVRFMCLYMDGIEPKEYKKLFKGKCESIYKAYIVYYYYCEQKRKYSNDSDDFFNLDPEEEEELERFFFKQEDSDGIKNPDESEDSNNPDETMKEE